MASFPVTQRCTSPAFLITRRLRRVCSRCRGEIWRGSCSGSAAAKATPLARWAVLQRDTGSGSKGACLERVAAGQQVLPCDRHLREVRGSAQAPLWITCRNAARRAQLGKNRNTWAPRAEGPRLYWALLVLQAVLSVDLLFFRHRVGCILPGMHTARGLIIGRFDQCRRQFVLTAQHVVKLRGHC